MNSPSLDPESDGAVTLRPIRSDDESFLYEVYASTRQEELAEVPWTAAEKEAFLRMQFAAQHHHYQQHYAGAEFSIILLSQNPIGRLYVARWEREIRIVDIALLPAYRGAGIGSRLLKSIQSEGERTGKPVTIHVEQFNPALRLYARLGFQRVSEVGVYYLMRWSPA